MPVNPGTHLGSYKILDLLGAGGMGEVYKAKDTRLERTVAIKVLSSSLSGRQDVRERFQREARAISSLNHPHICILYDVGHQDGVDYLVMEYLEGETLGQRLRQGPLPLDQVMRYSIEIADALDKAHQQGIIHRDLKPSNIMLTKSGAKLLDFGLAKLRAGEAGVAGLSALPTQEASLTAAGTILGTFQYMAPEQVEGKEADARTDIFAFGALLYEMITGRKAFEGKTQASLIGAILEREPPPLSSLQPMTAPALEHVVKRCLAKDPDERWQTAYDVMAELKWIQAEGSQIGTATAPMLGRKAARERLAWSLAVLFLAVSVLALGFAYLSRGGEDLESVAFTVYPPEKSNFSTFGVVTPLAVSPDGRRLVFGAVDLTGKNLLWVRSLNSLKMQPLEGTSGAAYPFWSPDSRFVAFFADGKLKKVDLSGGLPQTICEAPAGRGGAWNQEGVIVFARSLSDGLHRVSAGGGKSTPLTQLDASRQERYHRWPRFLPDGRRYMYLVVSNQTEHTRIWVGSLDSDDAKLLANLNSIPLFDPSGYLLFMSENTLKAQVFGIDRLELKGEPFTVAEQLEFYRPRSLGAVSISDNGVLVYRTGGLRTSQLVWFDREGKELGMVGPPGAYANMSLARDQSKVAVARVHPELGTDIWLIDVGRNALSRFTFDRAVDTNPVWSPDASRVVFASARTGFMDLYQKLSTGAGNEEALLKSPNFKTPNDWSPDGKLFLYAEQDPATNFDLWVLPQKGERTPVPFLKTQFDETDGKFSPDGRWIAYESNESGRVEVYVQSFPPSGGKWQISVNGGSDPSWGSDGKELFYISPDQKLMVGEVSTKGASFDAGVPRPLFAPRLPFSAYQVTGDGKRFLLNTVVEETVSPINVVLNWTASLAK